MSEQLELFYTGLDSLDYHHKIETVQLKLKNLDFTLDNIVETGKFYGLLCETVLNAYDKRYAV